MDSNNEMQDLIASVYTPMLVYIPSGILDNLRLEATDEMRSHPIFDTLFINKVNANPELYDPEKHGMIIYQKEQIFSNNIFKLYEIKGRNNEDAFKYLIEKYISQVRNHHDAFMIMVDNVEKYISNVSEVAKSNLEYQKNVTAHHLAELETKFSGYDTIETQNVESVLTNNNMFKIKSEDQNVEEKKSELVLGKKDSSQQKPQKRKKLVLATDKEVDDYLIKTFFNVKTTKNTTK